MNLIDHARIIAATARATSLIVSDDVPGQWWIKDPIDKAMADYQPDNTRTLYEPWWWKYRAGLDCVYCTSVHVAFWLTLIEHATRPGPPWLRTLWQVGTGALAVAWVAGHAEAYLNGGDDA